MMPKRKKIVDDFVDLDDRDGDEKQHHHVVSYSSFE